MNKADREALRARIDNLVTVHDGNTEVNACYYEVRLLGDEVWSRGGSYPETEKAAEAFARKLREKIANRLMPKV